jgi:DNA-binding XRE family transcriptional regulator
MEFDRQIERQGTFTPPYRRKTSRPYVPVETRQPGPRGKEIYEFRKRLGWTRCFMAEKLFVSAVSICYWEHGRIEPSRVTWEAFCRVKRNYQQRLRRQGKDLDGGPVMEEKP